jgi:hypothetical protein
MSVARLTRSNERKGKVDEGISLENPAKRKNQMHRQHIAEDRVRMTNSGTSEKIQAYERFQNYKRRSIIQCFEAIEDERFLDQFYQGNDENGRNVNLIFLTLQTGSHPKQFTHLCNSSSLKWNIKSLNIPSSDELIPTLTKVMLFVRGKHVEGTNEKREEYKYLGLTNIQSLSSGPNKDVTYMYTYVYNVVTLMFDDKLLRKELEWFGDNLMKCKKNMYGCVLCE